MRYWTLSVSFGVVSSLAIASTYIWEPDLDSSGGGVFAWNVLFYLPMMAFSIFCWTAALGLYICFIHEKQQKSRIRIMLPLVFLLPFIYEMILTIRFFVNLYI